MNFNNITFEELDKKIEAHKLIHSYVDDAKFEELKDQLVTLVKTMNFKSGEDLINYQNHPRLCGCLGPRNGFTLCPCAMYNAIDTYRFHIAKHLKAKQEEV